MMRYAALFSLSLMAAPLCADWKITTVTGRGRLMETEYYKDGMQRSDTVDPATGELLSVLVLDVPGKRSVNWDLRTREYTITRFHRSQPTTGAGRAIVFDVESTDTGERRNMFGREVRRVITVVRQHLESLPVFFESRTDGWYFESDSLPPGIRAHTAALFTAVDAHAPLPVKINQHGLMERGLPASTTTNEVLRNRLWRSSTSEVTEFFEGQLDPALFVPPPGFRRVFHVDSYASTWQDHLLLRWEWLQDWFAGLLR